MTSFLASSVPFVVGKWYRMYREVGWCLLPENELKVAGDQYCGSEEIAAMMNKHGQARMIITDGHPELKISEEQARNMTRTAQKIERLFRL